MQESGLEGAAPDIWTLKFAPVFERAGWKDCGEGFLEQKLQGFASLKKFSGVARGNRVSREHSRDLGDNEFGLARPNETRKQKGPWFPFEERKQRGYTFLPVSKRFLKIAAPYFVARV